MTNTCEGGTLIPVDGGAFVAASNRESVWRFDFANGLSVESLAAWRVTEQRGLLTYLLIGSLDVQDSALASRHLEKIFAGKELKVLCFEPDRLLISMQDVEEMLRLELLCLSVSEENWRIIGEDFVDSDKNRLLTSRQGLT